MVIKSANDASLLADTAETFGNLRLANMKLNPEKCMFGVEEGKFLGHIIGKKGIQANPKKTDAIANMASPTTIKEVQALNGKLAALGRFLSKSAERAMPFYKTLKGCLAKKDFLWSEEAELAFQKLKTYIGELPTLASPIPGETLTLYLSTTKEAISATLVSYRTGTQIPIYFVSCAL